MLCILLQRPGELVTRDELRNELWPADTFVEFDHSLNTAVKKIRQALDDSPRNPRCIETVPRQGYRFIAAVELNGARTGHDRKSRPGPQPPARRPWSFVLVILAVAGAVGATAYFAMAGRHSEPPDLKVVPLTTYPGFEFAPSFSPDGSQVAFTWCQQGSQRGSTQCGIYIKQIGEEKPFKLSDGPAEEISPAWSPDGAHIAFARVSAAKLQVVLVPQRGGRERTVAEFLWEPSFGAKFNEWRHIDWMPDNRWLVATGWEEAGGPSRIIAVDVETGAKHPLTDPPQYSDGDLFPSISPDGRALAFARSNEGTHLLELSEDMVAQGETVRLGSFPKGTAWTADGQEIVATGPWRGFWRMRPAPSASARQLPLHHKWAASPAISPRGDRLAFSSSTRETNVWRLELGDSEGKYHSPERLIASTGLDINPVYSPDGQKIAFTSDRTGSPGIWICDSDGTNAAQLTSFGQGFTADPRWSPDGDQIAFNSSAAGNRDIWVVSARGGEPRRLTTHPARANIAYWSANGKWIYFGANRGEGRQGWRVSPDGGEAEPFDFGPVPVVAGMAEDSLPEIFDDGVYYLGKRSEDGTHPILFKEFATGQVKTLGRTSGPAGFFSFSVSPDRSAALYAQFDAVGSDLMLVENFR